MTFTRWLALATALAAGVAVAPTGADAGEVPEVAYTCLEYDTEAGVPELSDAIAMSGTASPAAPKIFQPTTWTFDIPEPQLLPPIDINLQYLRVRIPVPEGLTLVQATLVADTGETPNPAASEISVVVSEDEIVVQLPQTPAFNKRLAVKTTGEIFYPADLAGDGGTSLVLPLVRVTAVPTPAAGGTTIEWTAPTIETALNYFGTPATVACTPDGETPPVLVGTTVATNRQLCDGQPVTVQLGFNTPTGGANVIQGTAGNDTTNGLGGNDRFCGLAGVDTFNGGPGADRALGGAGNDKLRGDAGNDRLQGDAGDDNLQGGTNNDALIGGANRDTCNGGPQNDTATTCEVRQSIP